LILITGSTGFLGSKLCEHLRGKQQFCTLARRNADICIDFNQRFNIASQLSGVSTIVHCAARAHHTEDRGISEQYFAINFEATKQLADQAKAAGVKRFVFISTIKVVTESSLDVAIDESMPPNPADDYAKSKYLAEQYLLSIVNANFEVVILRLPLMYGKGQKGNLQQLQQWLQSNRPLPLGAIKHNTRSLLFIGNAIAAIEWAICNKTKHTTFHLADKQPISTYQLVALMKQYLQSNSRIFAVPLVVLQLCLAILNKADAYQKLCGNLEVSTQLINQYWQPPFTTERGLQQTFADAQ